MSRSFFTTLEVRGYELDSFNHVNHANYLNYLEFARWKMLAEEGVTLREFQSWSRWPVIAGIEIQYMKPAFMGDELQIETKLIEFRRSSMRLSQTIRRGDQILTQAIVRSVIVDEKGRPAELPGELQEKWRKLLPQGAN